MFTPGEKVRVSVIEDGEGATTYHNLTVLECADGLLTIRGMNDEVSVYNMRSLHFVKAERQA